MVQNCPLRAHDTDLNVRDFVPVKVQSPGPVTALARDSMLESRKSLSKCMHTHCALCLILDFSIATILFYIIMETPMAAVHAVFSAGISRYQQRRVSVL